MNVVGELLERLQDVLRADYQIEREIGRGGMATVYLAEQRHPRRQVAIKVLDPLLANGIGRERFLREVEFSSQLTHPNIVPIFTAGEHEDLLYFVMPYIDGPSLRVRLAQQGPMPMDEAVRVAMEVGDALHYAHTQGVVHRDIKPENVMMSNSHALVGDFGIARAICVACGDNITVAGMPIGTPGYMSPEQSLGDEVDPRTDVYSLGCILYEMLTGRPPFQGPTIEAIISARYTRPTPTLRDAGWTDSPVIDRAVERAMALEPDARFETVEEFLNQIRPRLSSEVVVVDNLQTAELPPTLDPAARPPVKTVAVLPFSNLSPDPDNEYFSEGITDDIITQLSKITGLEVTSRTSVAQYKETTKSLSQIGQELSVSNILEGSVRRAGNRVRVVAQLIDSATDKHLWADRYDRELTDIFAIQSEISEHIARALEATLSHDEREELAKKPTENIEAYNHYLQGRFFWSKFTIDGVEKGIELFRRAVELDPDYAMAHAGIADSYLLLALTLGQMAPREAMPKAKAASVRALDLDGTLADAQASLGAVHLWYDWDWDAAERELRRALELEPAGEKAHSMLAFFLAAMGRHDEAIEVAREGERMCPVSILMRGNLGTQYYWARRYDEAIRQLRSTIDMESTFPPAHYILGWTYLQTGQAELAVEEATRGLELAGESPQRRAALAAALACAGQTGQAREMLDQIVNRVEHQYVSALDVAQVQLCLGQSDEALRLMDSAVEQRSPWLTYFNVEPLWDPLREDPRFQQIVHRVGLP